jgi:hypothetical protein
MPVVPFPSPSAKARIGPRPPTDPIERASTQAFGGETHERERQEDSTMARLRAEGDATGLHEQPSEFESSTSEGQSLDARAFTDAEEIGDTHAPDKGNPTEQDLPLVKPPPGQAAADFDDDDDGAAAADFDDDDDGAAAAASAGAHAAASAGAPKPDRLARGLRAFGFKPAARDERAHDDAARNEVGAFELADNAGSAGASGRPETSPLIPPPAPAPPRTATPPTATPAVAASPTATPATATPATATPATATPATGDPSAAAPASTSVKVPISTAPSSLPPPSEKQSATSGPSPACPQCEAPMAWVEEHLRFYCKSCKMYF